MSWNRPPPGVNQQYSSFNYAPGGFAPPTTNNPPPRTDYIHKPGVPAGGWDVEDEPVHLQRRNRHDPPRKFEDPPRRADEDRRFGDERRFSDDRRPDDRRFDEPRRNYDDEPRFDRRNEYESRLPVSEQAGVYERKLIEDITIPGGVRPRPSDKDLNDFSNKCKYLNCEIVMEILAEVVQDQPRSLKALYVIDRLVTEYESFKECARNFVREISSASHTPNHMKVLQPLLSKLGGPQPAVRTEELLLF